MFAFAGFHNCTHAKHRCTSITWYFLCCVSYLTFVHGRFCCSPTPASSARTSSEILQEHARR
jgi:hypothetical protein